MSTTADVPTARTASSRTANPLVMGLRALASLRLTVALLSLSVLLVFFGTLAQMNNGIWTVVDKYFWSEYVWVDFQLLVQFAQVFFGVSKETHVSGAFPFVGGRLLGFVMMANLLAAHATRFKLTWKRAGVWVLHAGVVLLFVGEIGTRGWQVEQRMNIAEGSYSDYAFDTRNYELAVISSADATTDTVTVVPAERLKKAAKQKQRVSHPDLPFDLDVVEYMTNSSLIDPPASGNPATAGHGLQAAVKSQPEVTGVDQQQNIDIPSAYVKLYKKGTDELLGTYLVSVWLSPEFQRRPKPQTVAIDGKAYDVVLRFTRYYKPFALYLKEFRFDRYVGTQKAKNYSSRIRLVDPERNEDREVLISMNNPFFYRDETYYQSNFDHDTEKSTELQVIRNPVWWVPYVACTMVSLGMLVHFGYFLVRFLTRTLAARLAAPAAARDEPAVARVRPTWQQTLIPWATFGVLALLYYGGYVARQTPVSKLDLREVARVPVVDGGRVKPLDTVARVDLRVINQSEQYADPDGKLRPALQWFLDTASAPDPTDGPAAKAAVFRIENDDVRNLLDLPRREGYRYSLREVLAETKGRQNYAKLRDAAAKAMEVPEKKRDLFQVKVLELWQNVGIANRTWGGEAPLILPPADGKEWRAPGSLDRLAEQFADTMTPTRVPQIIEKYLGFAPQDRGEFAAAVKKLSPDERERLFSEIDEAQAETESARAAMKEKALARVKELDRPAGAWRAVLDAYHSGDQSKLDAAVAAFREQTEVNVPEADRARVRYEARLNELAPFFHCIFVYLAVVLMCLAGWVGLAVKPGLGEGFRKAAFWVLLATFLVHTVSLVSRMYLMDRPLVFVTNLYSSAIFIGWLAVLLGLIVEALFPIGVGNFVAAVLGALTAFIAHQLALSGDTLEMMQAVLDTNFWLATHVTCVTFGYAATYVAGLVGVVYLILSLGAPNLLKTPVPAVGGKPADLGKVVGYILYGIVCLAALLSFTGTVLGGIWADQSWGRFWGWDPKENGAVLIVAWNALILHARWGGLVKDRGVAVLTLVGNMITTWSWFGTNQLGIGLHAYGFDNRLVAGCVITWCIHLALIAAALGAMAVERYAPRTATPALPKARRR